MAFIPNILLLFTHGSYHVPWELRPYLTDSFRKNNLRLLKNFSDFGTSYLIPADFPEEQRVVCWFSRAIGDPNRSSDHGHLFRSEDFNGNRIWKKRLGEGVKRYLWRRYYAAYHDIVLRRIREMERKHRTVIILDIHDTGNLLLGPDYDSDRERDKRIPMINLGNLDDTASSKSFMGRLADTFGKEFGERPWLNTPFKGGYVTYRYGPRYPNREMVQVELRRDLYVDEKRQELDETRVEDVRRKLGNIIRSI